MKQSTIDTLSQFCDPDRLAQKVVHSIHALERMSERCGASTVPYQSLIAVCVMGNVAMDSKEEVAIAQDIEPRVEANPGFATKEEVERDEKELALAQAFAAEKMKKDKGK